MITKYVRRKSECVRTQWAGGETTELFIFPPESVYSQRDFTFRLSTATITLPESSFTPLAGYERYLMVLEGETRLAHKGQHTKTLMPFDQDYFLGEWETKSYGMCRDFNLMMTAGHSGGLQGVSTDTPTACPFDAGLCHCFYSLMDGLQVQLALDTSSSDEAAVTPLEQGDLLVLISGTKKQQGEIIFKTDSSLTVPQVAGIHAWVAL